MIPLNSFFTSNSDVQPPFEGASGEYIRCGSTGGHPAWYNEVNNAVPMSSMSNNYFNSASSIGELWFDTMNKETNREFRCTPQSGSLTNLSSFIGMFFLHQRKLGEYSFFSQFSLMCTYIVHVTALLWWTVNFITMYVCILVSNDSYLLYMSVKCLLYLIGNNGYVCYHVFVSPCV